MSWIFNKEPAVDILLHLQKFPQYTLFLKISSVESDEIFAKERKLKPTKLIIDKHFNHKIEHFNHKIEPDINNM